MKGGDIAGLRLIVAASRPFSWVNTALPFLACALLADFALTPAVVVGTAYFLLPYNLLMYGVNDLFDYASDAANPRKGSLEGARLSPRAARTLWLAVAATNVPLLALLAWIAGPVAGAAVALAALVALVYSAPPIRTKERPGLDSLTSALHFALPATAGFLVAGLSLGELPWLPLMAFVAWGIASHALGAIQDIAYDRAAGIASIATAIGARRTAIVSMAGYAAAPIVGLTLGIPGFIAALCLSSYLLLPIPVLARPAEQQARRAWRSFLGLNLLVGFLLTQLLLRLWGVVPAYSPAGLLVGSTLLVAGFTLLNVAAGALALGRRPAMPPDVDLPSLTVVVPARNEEERLPETLASLRRLDYPHVRVVVVDDGSTDRTRIVATEGLPPGGSLLVPPDRPAGWSGKSWAAWWGARCTEDELVLFVDADTALRPDAVRHLAVELTAGGHDLVSGVTRYEMRSAAERWLIPGLPLMLFGFLPLGLLARTRGRPAGLAFAYGPLMLVRRSAYLDVGGHAAISASQREDVDLARAFARQGRSIGIVQAADLAATRHYRNGAEVAAAWRRIFFPYTGYSVPVALVALYAMANGWLLPFLLPIGAVGGWALGSPEATALLPLTVAGLALSLAARLLVALRQHEPLADILLTPVTVAATLVLQVRGFWSGLTVDTGDWRGGASRDATSGPARGAVPQGAAR